MSFNEQLYVGPYIILRTKEIDFKIGGYVRENGGMRWNPDFTAKFAPTFINLVQVDTDCILNDEQLSSPEMIEGYHNGEDGVTVIIPNISEYSDRGGPAIKDNTYPMGTSLDDEIKKDFIKYFYEHILYLTNQDCVVSVDVYYGALSYGN